MTRFANILKNNAIIFILKQQFAQLSCVISNIDIVINICMFVAMAMIL